MHVLDVSSVFDCAHSSITSALTTKHTIATKTTKRGPKSGNNKKKSTLGNSSSEGALRNDIKTNGKLKCKNDFPKNNSATPTKKTNLNDQQTSGPPTSGGVWTQVVQHVHDTQNIVMMAVLLVLIYLFCYDRTVRA